MNEEVSPVIVGISTCLLGENVRFDGGHKLDRFLRDTLGQYFKYVTVCPEVECGLPVPRESMHLVGDANDPQLKTIRTGVNHTKRMKQWGFKRLEKLVDLNLSGYIFKSRSPSSGMERIKIYDETGALVSTKGVGIWAKMIMSRFPLLPFEDEGRLHDPVLREKFIERVFIYRRWQNTVGAQFSYRALVEFHTVHKLLIMSHSPKHYRELGHLVGSSAESGISLELLEAQYIEILTAALSLTATVKKHTNVLQHIMGYFKKQLIPDEKQELLEVINSYHKGHVPLLVPITLLNHYVRKFDQQYLREQKYLNPHPLELKLRTHV
ncbi:YbgA family protein [Candidatus Latescibacterota bacterium]